MVPNLLARRLDGASVLQLFTPDCSADCVRRDPRSFHRPEGAITYTHEAPRQGQAHVTLIRSAWSLLPPSDPHDTFVKVLGFLFAIEGPKNSSLGSSDFQADHRDPLQERAHKQRSLREQGVIETSRSHRNPGGASQGSDWNTLSDDQESTDRRMTMNMARRQTMIPKKSFTEDLQLGKGHVNKPELVWGPDNALL